MNERNVEVVPAVLPSDFLDLQSSLSFLRGASPWVQVDLVDGEFVPSAEATWPFSESSHLDAILNEEEGLPFWEDFQFEFDLMVARPEELVDDFIKAGASRIVIHRGSTDKLDDILDRLDYTQIEAVISLSREDGPDVLEPYIERIAAVQVMGIAEIGVQGQPFDESALEQIRTIKEHFPDLLVQVDGSVNEDTVQSLVEAGTSRLISGSAILSADDARKKIQELTERATG